MGSFLTGKFLFSGLKAHISADFVDSGGLIRWASYGEGDRIDFLEYESQTIPFSDEFNQFVIRTINNLHLDFREELKISLSNEIEIAKITSSSHHMGTVSSTPSEGECSPVELSRNIFVAGSSIFQASVPGHPTMLAAATALVATDQIKSEIS
jgi:choline dehydrogenase-like flavoprotein